MEELKDNLDIETDKLNEFFDQFGKEKKNEQYNKCPKKRPGKSWKELGILSPISESSPIFPGPSKRFKRDSDGQCEPSLLTNLNGTVRMVKSMSEPKFIKSEIKS